MSSSFTINIKSSWLDRQRQLTIDKDFIEFDDKDLISAAPTKISKNEISAFRYGIKWINGYQFVIGRIYCIDIKSSSNEIIKIRLKTMYGINRGTLYKKYSELINSLYDYYFDDISRSYLKLHSEDKEFEILGVQFKKDGVIINDKSNLTRWEDLGTKLYSTYYSIFSLSNPDHYKAFQTLDDWNAGILYSVSRQILKDKNLYVE